MVELVLIFNMKTEYIILIYIVGLLLSLWRAMSFLCVLITNDVTFRKSTDREKQLIFILVVVFLFFISILSWVGFIGGIGNYFLEEKEEDRIFFLYK